MRGHTKSNRRYTPDFHFDLHAVFYLMRLKKSLQREGEEGTNTQRPLGCVFWVVEGDTKDNLTRKRRKGCKVKEVYNRNLKTCLNFLE